LKDSSLIAKRFDLGYFELWASPDYLMKHGAPRHPKELTQHNCLQFSRFKSEGFRLTNGKETLKVASRIVCKFFNRGLTPVFI
jgi:hypothetical protein